jgi:serine/threonine protein kinase
MKHGRTFVGGSLKSGAKLGAYEIRTPLGAGGMGEVYQASDWDVTVAIKVLPTAFVNRQIPGLKLFDRWLELQPKQIASGSLGRG